jgi:hypothetical protein
MSTEPQKTSDDRFEELRAAGFVQPEQWNLSYFSEWEQLELMHVIRNEPSGRHQQWVG